MVPEVERGVKRENPQRENPQAGRRHGWLMKAGSRAGEPPLPGPLLHKCVEEREKTSRISFMSQPCLFRVER
jgi:hypothetical protein